MATTIWHETLTVIKFYGLSKLLREYKLMDFKFTEAHVLIAHFSYIGLVLHSRRGKGAGYVSPRFTHGLSVEMAAISDDYFELESCIHLDTSCE